MEYLTNLAWRSGLSLFAGEYERRGFFRWLAPSRLIFSSATEGNKVFISGKETVYECHLVQIAKHNYKMSAFQFIAQAQPVVSVPVPPQPHIVQVRQELRICRWLFFIEKTTTNHSNPIFSTQVPQNVPVQFVPVNVPTPPPQVHNNWQYTPSSENYDIA